jgi:hypothetical protein
MHSGARDRARILARTVRPFDHYRRAKRGSGSSRVIVSSMIAPSDARTTA